MRLPVYIVVDKEAEKGEQWGSSDFLFINSETTVYRIALHTFRVFGPKSFLSENTLPGTTRGISEAIRSSWQ